MHNWINAGERVFPGDRIIVVRDRADGGDLALEITAQLARTLAIGAERQDLRLNRKMLANRVAKVLGAVERAENIRRGIDTARRGLDAAEDAYDEMCEDALGILYDLQDRL